MDCNTSLLMVDDDVKFCRLVRQYLEPLGYTVHSVHNGNEGLDRACAGGYAAVILDVMMPRKNGWDLLRELRTESQVPVLMLTALGDEPDRVAGLEMGADDYLPKTSSMRELLAHVRALLRRSAIIKKAAQAKVGPLRVGGLEIDLETHVVTLDGRPVPLTFTEFEIVSALASSAGRVRSREQLLLDAADRNFEVFDRSIDVHIASLRRKLDDDAKTPRFIETVRGVGYRMLTPTITAAASE